VTSKSVAETTITTGSYIDIGTTSGCFTANCRRVLQPSHRWH
jgi:hypothetical protein